MICLSDGDTESVVVGKRCCSLTPAGSVPVSPLCPQQSTACTTHIPHRSQGRDEGKLLEGKEVELALGNNF